MSRHCQWPLLAEQHEMTYSSPSEETSWERMTMRMHQQFWYISKASLCASFVCTMQRNVMIGFLGLCFAGWLLTLIVGEGGLPAF